MSFWKQSKEQTADPQTPDASAGSIPTPSDPFTEKCLDTLAAILRGQGDFAFDLAEVEGEETKERFEAWARHVLLGTASPGRPQDDSGLSARDWSGLRAFAIDHRRDEAEYVVRSLSDLRDTVWVFIQSLERVVPEDRAGDVMIGEQLGRLRQSVESNDTEVLKREALSSIGFIEQSLSERRQRSDAQIESLSSRVQEISDQLTEAREQLEVDALTGLYNRAALDDRMTKLVQLAHLIDRPPTIYMIDIDHFKWVNDRHGHPAGDKVLRAISACLRRSFSKRGHFVARYGGDEFCVLAQTVGREEDIQLGEGAVLAARDLEVDYEGEALRVGLSIGAARLRSGEALKDWVERSDRALYIAKEKGRDRFEPEEV